MMEFLGNYPLPLTLWAQKHLNESKTDPSKQNFEKYVQFLYFKKALKVQTLL